MTAAQRDSEHTALLGTALLAEFGTLKSEIAGRSAAQQLLVNLTLTIIGIVLGVAFSERASVTIVLVIPIFASCCAMLYFDHAAQITKISLYITERIHPMMAALTGDRRAFAWEAEFGSFHETRVSSFFRFGIPTLVLFVAGPLTFSTVMIGIVEQPLHWLAWSVGVILEGITAYLWITFIHRDSLRIGIDHQTHIE